MTVDELSNQFTQALRDNGNNYYTLDLKGWEVGILHGMIALAMDNPEVQKLRGPTKEVGKHFRAWCQGVFMAMGMSEEAAGLLDVLRERDKGVEVKDGQT